MIALLYIPFCVFFAWLNARWIAKGKKILHGINGSIHLFAAIIIGYSTKWQYGLAVLFITRLFFDVSLNIFRKLPVDYISPEVKAYKNFWKAIWKGKVVDYVEYKIFGNNGYLPKIIYALIIVILLTV